LNSANNLFSLIAPFHLKTIGFRHYFLNNFSRCPTFYLKGGSGRVKLLIKVGEKLNSLSRLDIA